MSILLLFLGLGIGVARVSAPHWPLAATQSRVYTEDDVTVFSEPEVVAWQGRALGPLAGGRGWAFERMPVEDPPQYFQAYAEEPIVLEGTVLVHGRFGAIDCAYALTVFGGQCTPVIEIDSFEPLP